MIDRDPEKKCKLLNLGTNIYICLYEIAWFIIIATKRSRVLFDISDLASFAAYMQIAMHPVSQMIVSGKLLINVSPTRLLYAHVWFTSTFCLIC